METSITSFCVRNIWISLLFLSKAPTPKTYYGFEHGIVWCDAVQFDTHITNIHRNVIYLLPAWRHVPEDSLPSYWCQVSNFSLFNSHVSRPQVVSFVFWRDSPQWARASSFTRFSISHTTTHHSRLDSSERVISSLQRPLPDNIQCSRQTDGHPWPWWDSNPQSQRSSGRRPMSYSAETGTGEVVSLLYGKTYWFYQHVCWGFTALCPDYSFVVSILNMQAARTFEVLTT
jgi:hypothetical protein